MPLAGLKSTHAHTFSAERKQSTVTTTGACDLNLFQHNGALQMLLACLLTWCYYYCGDCESVTGYSVSVCSCYTLQLPLLLVLLFVFWVLYSLLMWLRYVCLCSSVISIGRTFWLQKSSWHQYRYTVS